MASFDEPTRIERHASYVVLTVQRPPTSSYSSSSSLCTGAITCHILWGGRGRELRVDKGARTEEEGDWSVREDKTIRPEHFSCCLRCSLPVCICFYSL